jgi:hypothetical protein
VARRKRGPRCEEPVLLRRGGRQRFAFVTLGAVNGTKYEERVYFGDHGEVVRRLKRLVKGPGFPVQDEQGIRDPLMWIQTICK